MHIDIHFWDIISNLINTYLNIPSVSREEHIKLSNKNSGFIYLSYYICYLFFNLFSVVHF
jgi:hypothetical protein